MIQPLDTAEHIGIELAKAHHRALGEIHHPKLFQDPQPVFVDMPVDRKVKAFGAYAQHLMDLGEAARHPYYVDEYSRDLVVKQLEKLLRGNHLVEFVRARLVGELLSKCGRAWDKMDDDHPSKIARRKSLNRIFQETQSDYATGKGQRNCVIGFRMLGQALETEGANPFLRTQPPGKDNALVRLSFFLRMLNLRASTRQDLLRKDCGLDLVRAWASSHMALQRQRHELVADESSRQTTDSLAAAGWLALHHPWPLADVARKYWSQTSELAQAATFLPPKTISIVDEHLVRSGSSFLSRACLETHACARNEDSTTTRRKM